MAESWLVVAVVLSATRGLLSRRIYLHQGQMKTVRIVIKRMTMKMTELMTYGG